MGSEGSMEYVIGFRESEDYGKTAIISFFGNLRDYGGDEDLRGLLKWFMSIFDFVFYQDQRDSSNEIGYPCHHDQIG